jgi:hypothetical protein
MSPARTASQLPAFWLTSAWRMSRRRSSRLSVSVFSRMEPEGVSGIFQDISGYISLFLLIFFL